VKVAVETTIGPPLEMIELIWLASVSRDARSVTMVAADMPVTSRANLPERIERTPMSLTNCAPVIDSVGATLSVALAACSACAVNIVCKLSRLANILAAVSFTQLTAARSPLS
jgi:hypothetical protein